MLLRCVVIAIDDGVCTVQADLTHNVVVIKQQLHAEIPDLSAWQPAELLLFRAATVTAGQEANSTTLAWLEEEDHNLLRLLSWGILPPHVATMINTQAIAGDAIVGDVLAEAPQKEGMIHVVVTAPVADPTRRSRWDAINTIIKEYGGWIEVSAEEEEADDENEDDEPKKMPRLEDAVFPVVWPRRVPYVEPVLPPSDAEILVLSTLLRWGMHKYQFFEFNPRLWVHFMTPIMLCVAQRFDGEYLLDAFTIKGKYLNVHNFEVPFMIRHGTKRVAVVQVKDLDFKRAMVKAIVACELTVDRYSDCQWAGAVVTDAQTWVFVRSLGNRILVDECYSLQFDSDFKPDTESLGQIVGKVVNMLT